MIYDIHFFYQNTCTQLSTNTTDLYFILYKTALHLSITFTFSNQIIEILR